MQSNLLTDTTYVIHTNYKCIDLILNPYHMSSSKQKIKIQSNETVKMTYIPNRIEIPTYVVILDTTDFVWRKKLTHHQWNCCKGRDEEER
jgi:hypothetical protein